MKKLLLVACVVMFTSCVGDWCYAPKYRYQTWSDGEIIIDEEIILTVGDTATYNSWNCKGCDEHVFTYIKHEKYECDPK